MRLHFSPSDGNDYFRRITWTEGHVRASLEVLVPVDPEWFPSDAQPEEPMQWVEATPSGPNEWMTDKPSIEDVAEWARMALADEERWDQLHDLAAEGLL